MPLPERPARMDGRPAGPSVQGWVLSHLIRWVESQGADAAGIRRLPGAEQLADPDFRVPEATMESAWRLAAQCTRDDAIGIHVAESLPRGAFDLVEYAVRASPSLAVGLERLAGYGRLVSDRVAGRVEMHAGSLMLLIRDRGAGPLHPARAEFALATALKTARECAGDDITPQQVSFVHPAPADVTEHRQFFRIPVRFGSGANAMTLSADDAKRRMRDADEALLALVRRRLDKAVAAEEQTGSLASRVRRLLVESLGRHPLSPDGAAQALAVSRRTLCRRLAEEGTSFRMIFDDVRRESACGLLLDRTLSVADIAFFLQYSEPAAFHRSFRRWTNQTPVTFRNTGRNSAGPAR